MKKYILKYFKGYGKWAIISPILVLLAVVLRVYIPLLTGQMINDGIMAQNLEQVVKTGIYMALAALFAMLCGAGAAYAAARASQGFGANLRQHCFSHIQTYDFSNIDQFSVPSLITRLTSDVDRLTLMAQLTLRMAVRAPFMFITSFLMALRINRELSLVFFFAIPLMTFFIIVIGRKAQKLFRKQQNQLDRLNAAVQENLSGIRIVKSFVREDFEIEKFELENGRLRDISLAAMMQIIKLPTAMIAIVSTSIVAVLYFGSKGIVENWLLPGDLFSFLMYINMVLNSVGMIFLFLINYARAKASSDRILEILETESGILEQPAPLKELADGSIEFKNLSFKYAASAKDNLHDISFRIESGETLAIIGSTGSGKSTLVQLLPRLYERSSGELYLGGAPVEAYALEALREQVAIVLQKNTLFSGTIRDNLLWGKADASEEELWTVLRIAQAEELVKARPGGLDALVEQGGANFSGGQKQRLTIARSLLKKPKIIVFDDSSSALDFETDRRLQAALAKELPEMTKLIIAQRIATAEQADRILVLDKGEINGLGTAAELLANNRIYREIAESQAKGVVA
ncbi:MAG: ABC transporter ATP-binding protein [Eubacteriales bacterium]|nr:ABC transporter ATP-binding protein [Eubacteriales bacterium]